MFLVPPFIRLMGELPHVVPPFILLMGENTPIIPPEIPQRKEKKRKEKERKGVLTHFDF